jgi:hypothetical protein
MKPQEADTLVLVVGQCSSVLAAPEHEVPVVDMLFYLSKDQRRGLALPKLPPEGKDKIYH